MFRKPKVVKLRKREDSTKKRLAIIACTGVFMACGLLLFGQITEDAVGPEIVQADEVTSVYRDGTEQVIVVDKSTWDGLGEDEQEARKILYQLQNPVDPAQTTTAVSLRGSDGSLIEVNEAGGPTSFIPGPPGQTASR